MENKAGREKVPAEVSDYAARRCRALGKGIVIDLCYEKSHEIFIVF